MGIAFGIFVALASVGVFFLQAIGQSNWTTGQSSGPTPWWTLVIGFGFAGILIYSHWHPWRW